MPLLTLHLLSLHPSTTIPHFLKHLTTLSPPLKPLVTSLVIRWIILPTTISTPALLAFNIHWDILLILPTSTPLPASTDKYIAAKWSVNAGVPSKLLQGFEEKNNGLLHPIMNPSLTGADGGEIGVDIVRARIEKRMEIAKADSAQGLELSGDLWSWIQDFGSTNAGKSAVSMLNLLAFKEGMKEEYLKYGAEFARGAGRKRGGDAKIVGTVVHDTSQGGNGTGEGGKKDDAEGWDEVALAHYPSIWHFADMLASEDYQDVNKKYRQGSLRDTFILCTSEVAMEEVMEKGGKHSKL